MSVIGTSRTWRRVLPSSVALAQLGRIEEAKIEGRLFMAEYPRFRIKSFLDTQPFRNPADRANFAEGYRKAALPE